MVPPAVGKEGIMSKEIKGNGKHLTLDDRSTLQAGLDQKKSFRAIAKELHKDPSTLAKEVKLNRTDYGRCFYTSSFGNLCKYARLCKKRTYAITGPNVRHLCAADAGYTIAAGFARIL